MFDGAGGGTKFYKICHTSTIPDIIDVSMFYQYHLKR